MVTTSTSRVPERGPEFPGGDLIVRDCGDGPEAERANRGGGNTGGGGYGGLGGLGKPKVGAGAMPAATPGAPAVAQSAPAPVASAPPPPPAKPVSGPAERQRRELEALAYVGSVSGSASLEEAAPRAEVAAVGGNAPRDQAERETKAGEGRNSSPATEVLENLPKGLTHQGADGLVGGVTGEDRNKNIDDGVDGDVGALADAEDARRGTLQDWGAKIFLSNDDSMSLASAQRLLYAVRQGVAWTADQVRPHELLNYFSFDTVDPRPGDAFGVSAAMRREGDGVAMAVAIEGAMPSAAPLDLTIVLDRSGSMHEEGRMDYTKRALDRMTSELRPGDRLDLVLFDHQVCTPVQNWVAGRDDVGVLRDAIAALAPRGSTDLDLGLREGYAIARGHEDTAGRNRRMMVITDALLNTGAVDTDVVSEIGKSVENDGIRLTGVGVGREFNDRMLQQLTEKGKGAYVFLGSEAVVDRLFGVGFRSLVTPLALDVQFELDLPPSLAMTRFYGEEASTVAADVMPVNYQAGNTQLFLQELAYDPARGGSRDPVELTIRWTDPIDGKRLEQAWTATVGDLMAADSRNVDKALALMSYSDVLVAQAMGSHCDMAALGSWGERRSAVADDAEIAFVDGLVGRMCPSYKPGPVQVARAVDFKVKVDSDVAISEVQLACGGRRDALPLVAGGNVARFSAVPGTCTATLMGPVEMTASVTVPKTGGEARCLVRGGRIACS